MSDVPPPPPPPPPEYMVPVPQPGTPRRPSILTAAAVILIVVGGLGLLGALLLFGAASNGGRFLDRVIDPDTARTVGFVQLVFSAAQILAAIFVLKLRSGGRIAGIVVASLAAVLSLFQISGNPAGVISLGLNAFVVYALAANGHVFS